MPLEGDPTRGSSSESSSDSDESPEEKVLMSTEHPVCTPPPSPRGDGAMPPLAPMAPLQQQPKAKRTPKSTPLSSPRGRSSTPKVRPATPSSTSSTPSSTSPTPRDRSPTRTPRAASPKPPSPVVTPAPPPPRVIPVPPPKAAGRQGVSFAGPPPLASSSDGPAPPQVPLAEVREDEAPPRARPAAPRVPSLEELEQRRSLVGPLAFDAKSTPKNLPKKAPPARLQEISKLYNEVELKKDLLNSGQVSDTEGIKKLRAELEVLSGRLEESHGADEAGVPPMRAPEEKQPKAKAPPAVLTAPPVAPPVSTKTADFLGPDWGPAGPPEIPPEEDRGEEKEALAEAPPRLPRGTFSRNERLNLKGSSGDTLEVGSALVASTSSSSCRDTLPYSKVGFALVRLTEEAEETSLLSKFGLEIVELPEQIQKECEQEGVPLIPGGSLPDAAPLITGGPQQELQAEDVSDPEYGRWHEDENEEVVMSEGEYQVLERQAQQRAAAIRHKAGIQPEESTSELPRAPPAESTSELPRGPPAEESTSEDSEDYNPPSRCKGFGDSMRGPPSPPPGGSPPAQGALGSWQQQQWEAQSAAQMLGDGADDRVMGPHAGGGAPQNHPSLLGAPRTGAARTEAARQQDSWQPREFEKREGTMAFLKRIEHPRYEFLLWVKRASCKKAIFEDWYILQSGSSEKALKLWYQLLRILDVDACSMQELFLTLHSGDPGRAVCNYLLWWLLSRVGVEDDQMDISNYVSTTLKDLRKKFDIPPFHERSFEFRDPQEMWDWECLRTTDAPWMLKVAPFHRHRVPSPGTKWMVRLDLSGMPYAPPAYYHYL